MRFGHFEACFAIFCLTIVVSPATAKDATEASALISAAKPETVVAALQEAGYKAKLVQEPEKNPYIETNMGGYSVDVHFSGCKKGVNCSILSFRTSFEADSIYTLDVANKWNKEYSLTQMYVLDDGGLGINYDLTTVGGLTPANFAEVTNWYDQQLGVMDSFVDEARLLAESKGSYTEKKPDETAKPVTEKPTL